MIDLTTSLKLVPVDNIKMHETYQPTRLEKTMLALSYEQVLKNPIVTTKINESDYMIIDGVHRFLSLKNLGLKTVACQIVKEEDVKLYMWSHFIEKGKWLKDYADENLIITEKEVSNSKYAFKITDSEQKSLYFYVKKIKSIMDYVDAMHNIVARYHCKQFLRVDQMNKKNELDEEEILVEFYNFSWKEINNLVSKDVKLPTGVTHFSINNRLLNIKIPLEYMKSNISEGDWHNFVQSIQENLRYYPESIYLCE